MKKTAEYFNTLHTLLEKAERTQADALRRAAVMIADAFSRGGWLYSFGTGHSHLLAEEIFYRAGGMARVRPMLETGLMLHEGAAKSTELERLSGYAEILFEEYAPSSDDVILIISNSGRNSLCIEMAEIAKKNGVKTVALTSVTHSSNCSSRDKSGKKLFELSDIVLDNGGCYGDACIKAGDKTIAPTSTVIGAALLNALECEVVEEMDRRGEKIELFISANVDSASSDSADILKKYRGVIKSL